MLNVRFGNVGGLIRARMFGTSSQGEAAANALLPGLDVHGSSDCAALATVVSAAPPSSPPATRPPARRRSRRECNRAMVVLLNLKGVWPEHLHPSTSCGPRIIGSFRVLSAH